MPPSLPRKRPAPRFLAVGAPLLILVGSGFAGLQHLLSGKLEIKVGERWFVGREKALKIDCFVFDRCDWSDGLKKKVLSSSFKIHNRRTHATAPWSSETKLARSLTSKQKQR